MKASYVVVYEEAQNNYCAYLPDFPGCISTGKTWDEVQRMVREALEFHIEGMIQHGDSLPESPISLEAAKAYHNKPLSEREQDSLADYGEEPPTLTTTFGTVEVEITVFAVSPGTV